MANDKRCKGYVVGSDTVNKEIVWKVKATSASGEGQQHLGKKFEVASTHGEILLAKGLDVTFIVGSFGKHKYFKAVDVDVDVT